MEAVLPRAESLVNPTPKEKNKSFFESSFNPNCGEDLFTYVDQKFTPKTPIQQAYEILNVLGVLFEGERKKPLKQQLDSYRRTRNTVLDVVREYSRQKNWDRIKGKEKNQKT